MRKINVRKFSGDDADLMTFGASGKKHPQMGIGRKKGGRRGRTVIQEHGELNPLKPCGSCNEWLKKIAEVQPNFKVITFTDYSCDAVYCSEVRD